MAKNHNPTLQFIQILPCQQSDTVIWRTWKSLQRWRTRTNDMKKIQPFVLKSGNSINDHPNDNVPNAKLKSLYNVVKSVWLLNYGRKKFSPHHMNYVLFEAWNYFNTSAGNIIRDRFSKNMLSPPQTYQLNNKYLGICCLHPSIFWIQGWRNKQYNTPYSCAYQVTG